MEFDGNQTGLLTVESLRAALKGAELGLTPIKIHSMMASVYPDENGMVVSPEPPRPRPPSANTAHSPAAAAAGGSCWRGHSFCRAQAVPPPLTWCVCVRWGLQDYAEFAHTAAIMLEAFLKPLTREEAQFMGEASRLSGSDLLPVRHPGLRLNTPPEGVLCALVS